MQRGRLKKGRIILLGLILAAIIFLAFSLYKWMTYTPVKKSVVLETGDLLDIEDFLNEDIVDVDWKKGLTDEQLSQIGDYQTIIVADGKEYTTDVKVRDTIAPTATLKKIKLYQNQDVFPENFVEDIEDETTVIVTMKKDISTKKLGPITFSIILEDAGGNQTEIEIDTEIVEDKEPPVIEGVKDMEVVKGETPTFGQGITIKDNADTNIDLQVDASRVNLNVVGKYEVIYSAKDKAGNTTSEIGIVTVIPDKKELEAIKELEEQEREQQSNEENSNENISDDVDRQ